MNLKAEYKNLTGVDYASVVVYQYTKLNEKTPTEQKSAMNDKLTVDSNNKKDTKKSYVDGLCFYTSATNNFANLKCFLWFQTFWMIQV